MNRIPMIRGLGAVALALALSACESSLSLDAAGQLQATMQRTSGSLFSPSNINQGETQQRSVAPDTVSSFMVTVTSMQVLHANSDSINGGSWTTVHLRSPMRVNLMALGRGDDSARVIADGQVEAGNYTRVRLTLANPTIRFKGNVGFGVGGILQGGVDYAVDLAGTSDNTIEIVAGADVDAGSEGTIALVFDDGATLGSVAVGSAGEVILLAAISGR